MLNTLKLYEAMTGGEPDARARAFVNELDEQMKDGGAGKSDLAALSKSIDERMNSLFYKIVAAVAVMLLGHLIAVYAIIGSFLRAGAS